MKNIEAVPFGEHETGIWCGTCQQGTVIAQTVSTVASTHELRRVRHSLCTSCGEHRHKPVPIPTNDEL